MAQLEAEQKETATLLKDEQPKGATASSEPSGMIKSELPEVCSEHIEQAHQQFSANGFSKDLWFQHVFECKECCGPILTDVMDEHVNLVVKQPHVVVLFQFDRYAIQPQYQQQLKSLIRTSFDASRDKVLLIGRASKIGDRGYNVALSGKRAGEIRDFLIQTFDITDEQIRYQFFGFDPPQLTMKIADQYGIAGDGISDCRFPCEKSGGQTQSECGGDHLQKRPWQRGVECLGRGQYASAGQFPQKQLVGSPLRFVMHDEATLYNILQDA